MPVDPTLLDALATAVAAAPDDLVLRGRYASLLGEAGRADEALEHALYVLTRAPDDRAALGAAAAACDALGHADRANAYRRLLGTPPAASGEPPAQPSAQEAAPTPALGFDWSQAEQDVSDLEPIELPMWSEALPADDLIEAPDTRLSDVGGMRDVKKRLDSAFLAPMRNPELRRTFAKSLRGGLLLYGPPGCGKTFIARALAGELGAGFASVGLADVLSRWMGESEGSLRALFQAARRNAPTVLFIDELDAIGQRRSDLSHSAMRSVVNQLLVELDGVDQVNEGVFVLAATNAPWDVDPALKRPGRFDRMMLVLPPDPEARAEILRTHLRERPVGKVDLTKLVRRTEGFSGADLAYVCEVAAEMALEASIEAGEVRPITEAYLDEAARQVTPSTAPWFDVARNVVLYANESRQYDELLQYMRRSRLV